MNKQIGSGRKAKVTKSDVSMNYQYLNVLLSNPGVLFLLQINDKKQEEAVAQFLRRRGCKVNKMLDTYRVMWTHRPITEETLNFTIRKLRQV